MEGKEELSVKEALERGRKMLDVPSSVVPKVIIGVMILLALLKVIAWQYALFSLPLSLVLFPLFYRSYRVTKWKLWAYEHTRNVNELRAKAVMYGIISEDEGFLEKLFRTTSEAKKLEGLKQKFRIPDLITDQPEIASETVFYYSVNNLFLPVLLIIFGAVNSLYCFLKNERVLASAALIFAIVILIWTIRKRKEKALYLSLSDKGIGTSSIAFISWEEISGEKIIRGKVDDGSDFYLVFNTILGEEMIGIDRLRIKPAELLDLMILYRQRFEMERKETIE